MQKKARMCRKKRSPRQSKRMPYRLSRTIRRTALKALRLRRRRQLSWRWRPERFCTQKISRRKEYPASITKLMTVLIALENGNLDDTVTFSQEAVYSIEPGSSHLGIRPDEQLSLRQSLFGHYACIGKRYLKRCGRAYRRNDRPLCGDDEPESSGAWMPEHTTLSTHMDSTMTTTTHAPTIWR